MNPRRFATVLFDLDGTLTDSQSGIVAAYAHTLHELGLTAPEAEVRKCIGPPLRDSLSFLGVPAGRIENGVDIYRAYFSVTGIFDNRLYPGIPELLESLTSSGVVLGLATSKLTEFAETIVDHFAIADHFAVVVGATRNAGRLHKDDIVAYALECLGDPPRSATAMVGDRDHDIFAATAHGLAPIGVLWGYGGSEELCAAGATTIVGTVEELSAALLEPA